MATRRSRIKAVANLSSRRNRPLASNDSQKENLIEEENDVPTVTKVEASEPSHKASDPAEDVKCESQKSQTPKDSPVTPVDDTKRDDQTNISATRHDDDATSTLETNSISENPTTCTSKATDDNSNNSNKRVPLRSRRSKPTVNLTAAARKRPANDSFVTSPCSPPPVKVKCLELPSPKSSGSENNNDVPVSKSDGVSNQILVSESNYSSSAESNQTSTPLSPSPVPVPSSPSNRSLSGTSNQFKTPATPRSKEPSCSDASNKGDGTMPVSPQKDPSASKRKQSTNAQRVAAARKTLKTRISSDGTPPRSALTMFDLIFYNPSKNPMKSAVPSSNESRPRLNSVSSVSSIHEDRLNEESVDDIDGAQSTEDTVEETAMPVPQVKVGPDGSLILDEQSLVIETTGAKKSREELEKSEVIVDTGSSYGHYKKIARSKDWSDHETKKFYRALSVVGTDFSLMKPYFRNRTRRELKIKFKKEERFNANLIDKALGDPLDFDISELEKECELEDEEEKRAQELAKEKAVEKSKENPQDVPEKARKQNNKKKKAKRSVLLSEIGLEEENSPAPKKAKPQVVGPKKKKISDADTDYNMLAMGVDLQDESSTKAKKKQTPGEAVQLIQEQQTAAGNNILKMKSVKHIRRKSPTSDSSLALFTSNSLPDEASPIESSLSKISTNDPKVVSAILPSRIQFGPAINQGVVPTSESVVVPPTCQSVVQIIPVSATPQTQSGQVAPLTGIPLASIGATTPKTVNILRRPVSTPQPSSLGSKASVSQSTVCSLPASNSQVSVVTTPSNSTSVVSTSGARLAQESPLSRMRTVQVSPHTTPATPGIGVTTPVSRLLPATPPLPRMEPGSIIVLKTPLPQDPNRHVLQVYMVTNTPPGSGSLVPHSPIIPGINLLSGPTVQPVGIKSPCMSDDSDCERVLTKL